MKAVASRKKADENKNIINTLNSGYFGVIVIESIHFIYFKPARGN